MMIPQYLCWNCMTLSLTGEFCTHCGKSAHEKKSERPANALPEKYQLANRYLIGRVLGEGGFGITYLAWDMQTSNRVALKEFFPRTSVDRGPSGDTVVVHSTDTVYFDHVRTRFIDEAQFMHRMRTTPEIINVYHLFQSNNTAYYSMEFLEGSDLKHYLKKNGTMTWNSLSQVIRPILRALSVVHANNYIHRDISPDNIFVLPDGSAKLIDFGSVRSYGNGLRYTTIFNRAFAAPEMYYENGHQGPWTDIFSLCSTIYYALSGKLPESSATRAAQRYSSQTDPLLPISGLCPQLPSAVAEGITKGLSLDVAMRFSNVEEVYQAFFSTPMPLVSTPVVPQTVFSKPSPAPASRQQQQTPVPRRPDPDPAVPTTDSGQVKVIVYCGEGMLKGAQCRMRCNDSVSVGRLPDCTIQYPPAGGVSRHHCTFVVDRAGHLFVSDDNSTNGTFVNGKRIPPFHPVRLQENSRVKIGNDIYWFHFC